MSTGSRLGRGGMSASSRSQFFAGTATISRLAPRLRPARSAASWRSCSSTIASSRRARATRRSRNCGRGRRFRAASRSRSGCRGCRPAHQLHAQPPSGLYVGPGGLICRNWPYGRLAGAKLPPGSHPASNATRWPEPGRVGECAERLHSCSRSSEPELLPGLCLCRAREHPQTKPSSSRFGLKRSGHSRSINGAAGGRSSARRPTAGQGLRSTCDPRSASAIARPGCPTTPSSSGSVILTWSTRKPGPSAEVGRSGSGG